jgi:cyclic pyranopterin phosphate synthase
MAPLGVSKVRITGGEPLVRRGAVGLIRSLVAIEGIETVALTTNGERLAELAEPLAATGLERINVSIDSLEPEVFSRITHGGDLAQVLAGVDRALELGFPLKINTVLLEGLNTHALGTMVEFARARGIGLRFIELMTFDSAPTRFTETDAVELLSRDHEVEQLPRDPAQLHVRRYAVDGTEVGFISPLSHSFCGDCNKLRLTPDGGLRVCLASRMAVDLRSVLRRPHTAADLENAIRLAVAQKPRRAEWDAPGEMWKVGG